MMIQDENICTDESFGVFVMENTDTRIASFIYNSPKKRNRLKTYIIQKRNQSPDCSTIDIGLVKVENISFPSHSDSLRDTIFSLNHSDSGSPPPPTPLLVNSSTPHAVFLENESTYIPESPVYSNSAKPIDSQNSTFCVNMSNLLPHTAASVAEEGSNIGVQYPFKNVNDVSDEPMFTVKNFSVAHDSSDHHLKDEPMFTVKNISVAYDSSDHHLKATDDNSLSPVVPFVPVSRILTASHEVELGENELQLSKVLPSVESKSHISTDQDNAATSVNELISSSSASVSEEASAGVELKHIIDKINDSIIVTKRRYLKIKMPSTKNSKALRKIDPLKLDAQNNNQCNKMVSTENCEALIKNKRITFTVPEVNKYIDNKNTTQPIPEKKSHQDHVQKSISNSQCRIPKRDSSLSTSVSKKSQFSFTDSVTTNYLIERPDNQLEGHSNVTKHDYAQSTRRTLRSQIIKCDQNAQIEKTNSLTIGRTSNKPKIINTKGLQEIKKQGSVEQKNTIKNNSQKENKLNRDPPAFKTNSKSKDTQLQLLSSRKSITDKSCSSIINAKEVYVPQTKNTSSISGSQLVMAESDKDSSATDNISEVNKTEAFSDKELRLRNTRRKQAVEHCFIQQEDSKDQILITREKKSRVSKNKNKQTVASMDIGTENTLELQPVEQAMSTASSVQEEKSTSQAKKKGKQSRNLKAEQKPTIETSARPSRNKRPDKKDLNEPVLMDPKSDIKEEVGNGESSPQKVKPLAEKKEPKPAVNTNPSKSKKKDHGKHSEETVITGPQSSELALKVESEELTNGKVTTHSLPEQQDPKKLAVSTARPSRKKNQNLRNTEEAVVMDLQSSEKEDMVKSKAIRKGRAKDGNLLAEKQAPKPLVGAKPVRGKKQDIKKDSEELVIGDTQASLVGESRSEMKSQKLDLRDNKEPFVTSARPSRKKKQETKSGDFTEGKPKKLNSLHKNQEKKEPESAKPSRPKKRGTTNGPEQPAKFGIRSHVQEDTKQPDETKQNVKKVKSKQTVPMAVSVPQTASKEAGSSSKLKYVGVHCSISGGLSKAVCEAMTYGARSFGLFLRNGRKWTLNAIDEKEVEKFKRACIENNYFHNQILPHGSYLLNCGSSSPETLRKSRETLIHELKICEQLGLRLYTFHPGSACHGNSVSECIKTIAESINLAHQETKSVKTVIENMSGQGKTIGGKLEELKAVIDQVEDKSRIGVCLDTCHAFAAGYNIATRKGYEQFMEDFNSIIGLEYLCAVHLNDAKDGLGSNSDRHENIGKGHIGLEGFRHIMNDPRFNNLPMILETPKTNYAEEVKTLYGLSL